MVVIMTDQDEGTITRTVRILRRRLEKDSARLRALTKGGEKREPTKVQEKRGQKLALARAYPSRLKKKGDA